MYSKFTQWLIAQVVVKAIVSGVDKVLGKIPGDGAKSLLGILLAIIGVALEVFPEYEGVIIPIRDGLNDLGITPMIIVGTGIGSLVIGYTHKIAKWLKALIDGEDQQKK